MRKAALELLIERAERENAELRVENDRLQARLAEPTVVRVHQTGGRPTLEGLLVQREPTVRLDNAHLVESEERSLPLDGGVEVLREHVSFMQILARVA